MGTRGLNMVISKKETKVAQYGQWDHYPSGQGLTALLFLSRTDLTKFKEKVDTLHFSTDAEELEVKTYLASVGADNGWMTMEQAAKVNEVYPHLNRDMGAEILEYIMLNEVKFLCDNTNFAADSIFCEWAYVIDLDKRTFEIYKGFNKTPLTETDRFYSLQAANLHHEDRRGDDQYFPVKLVKEFSLDALPTKDEFLAAFEEKEETEE